MSFDVIIIGAGPVGLCLGRSLSHLGLKVVIIEKQSGMSLEQPAIDGRDIALTQLSQRILETLDVWGHIPTQEVSYIRTARVFDGNSAYHMELLPPEASLGMIVPNHLIRAAAYKAVEGDKNITIMEESTVKAIHHGINHITVTLTNGTELTAALLVASDSRFSETRRLMGISADMHDFGKSMIVCQMRHTQEHNGVAYECFHYGHTLAVLPLNGNRSSVIITHTPAETTRLMAMDDETFSHWVSSEFSYRLGTMQLDNKRHTYPLVAAYAERFVGKRFALIGDAAVGMHPVTAHGFNFGLKGIQALCHEIRHALDTQHDIGSDAVLANYERKHRIATKPLYLATNSIVGLYTNDNHAARAARKILLHIANRVQPVKRHLMKRLTATSTPSPLPRPFTALRNWLKAAA